MEDGILKTQRKHVQHMVIRCLHYSFWDTEYVLYQKISVCDKTPKSFQTFHMMFSMNLQWFALKPCKYLNPLLCLQDCPRASLLFF